MLSIQPNGFWQPCNCFLRTNLTIELSLMEDGVIEFVSEGKWIAGSRLVWKGRKTDFSRDPVHSPEFLKRAKPWLCHPRSSLCFQQPVGKDALASVSEVSKDKGTTQRVIATNHRLWFVCPCWQSGSHPHQCGQTPGLSRSTVGTVCGFGL